MTGLPLARNLAVITLLISVASIRAEDPTRAASLKPALSADLAGLVIEPGSVTLAGARDLQSLLVTGKLADGTLRDLTREVSYQSLSPQIVTADDKGVLRPVATGS